MNVWGEAGKFIAFIIACRCHRQVVANHAATHGIDQRGMAPYPEQRITMEASGTLMQVIFLLGNEPLTRDRVKPD